MNVVASNALLGRKVEVFVTAKTSHDPFIIVKGRVYTLIERLLKDLSID